MSEYRVIKGERRGDTGTPESMAEDGSRLSLLIDGEEVWFNRDQVTRLICDVLTCRNWSLNPSHGFCKTCYSQEMDTSQQHINDMNSGKVRPTKEELDKGLDRVEGLIRGFRGRKDD